MNTDMHYSTIVIGAGPAGLMAACAASARGPVLVVDAMKLPRSKSCGGMLNEYSQAFIADTLRAKLPKDILVEPNEIRFRYFDWDRDIRKATTLKFVNVDRAGFDEWLCGFLPDNVDLEGNTKLIYFTQKRGDVTVQLRAADDPSAPVRSLTCDYLVGADGPRSSVRAALPVYQFKHYKTLQDFLPLHGEMEPFFDCVYARGIGPDYGYGYLIPKGDVAILGSVFFPGSKGVHKLHEKARGLYSSFYPYDLEHVKREAWSAVQVRSMHDIQEGWGRVLLAGESAGLFSPSSGEGISFAMNSGMLAGNAIAVAHEGATVLGKRDYLSSQESEALRVYRETLAPMRKNIARRLRFFPIMNSDWGKWLGKYVPDPLIDVFTHQI